MSDDALDTEDEEKDPTFDLYLSLKEDIDHITWRLVNQSDNKVFLGLFLYFQLTKVLTMGEMRVAEVAGMMNGKSERTELNPIKSLGPGEAICKGLL